MRIRDPASVVPIDEARAGRIHRRIVQGLLGCICLWTLAACLLAWGSPWPAVYAVLLAAAPWLWAAGAWMRFWGAPWSPGWSPPSGDKVLWLLLTLFAIPAVAPAFFLGLIYTPVLLEVLPNSQEANNRFRHLVGETPAGSVTRVYHSRRDARLLRHIPWESSSVEILQFSAPDSATAARLLSGAGLSLSRPGLSESEKGFHPRHFPSTWLPLALSPDLEVWRANGATAWVDSKNRTVYMVLSRGWLPRRL